MIDRAAQSNRLTRLATNWFEMVFDALREGRKEDAIVARLAHAMCVAAHENLVDNLPSDEV